MEIVAVVRFLSYEMECIHQCRSSAACYLFIIPGIFFIYCASHCLNSFFFRNIHAHYNCILGRLVFSTYTWLCISFPFDALKIKSGGRWLGSGEDFVQLWTSVIYPLPSVFDSLQYMYLCHYSLYPYILYASHVTFYCALLYQMSHVSYLFSVIQIYTWRDNTMTLQWR